MDKYFLSPTPKHFSIIVATLSDMIGGKIFDKNKLEALSGFHAKPISLFTEYPEPSRGSLPMNGFCCRPSCIDRGCAEALKWLKLHFGIVN